MKRTAFKRRAAPVATDDRESRLSARAERALATPAIAPRAARVVNAGMGPVIAKSAPVRHEGYRRLVAALPCIYCGIAGFSQTAHENGADKALGMKQDDRRTMPLCCPRMGVEGCHAAYDSYHLLEGGREAHREAGERWSAHTRATIINLGLWPKDLPLWKED